MNITIKIRSFCQLFEGKSFKIRSIFYLCIWIENFRNVVNLHPLPPRVSFFVS